MKKIIVALLAAVMMLSLTGCSSAETGSNTKTESNTETESSEKKPDVPVAIKSSPDKYTWYVKNYVGTNAASIGYTAISGFRMDADYGAGLLKIIYVAEDGTYIDPEDEEQLKEYVITGQNIEPNTEIKLTFQTDSDGKEYDNLVSSQSIETIELRVAKID